MCKTHTLLHYLIDSQSQFGPQTGFELEDSQYVLCLWLDLETTLEGAKKTEIEIKNLYVYFRGWI